MSLTTEQLASLSESLERIHTNHHGSAVREAMSQVIAKGWLPTALDEHPDDNNYELVTKVVHSHDTVQGFLVTTRITLDVEAAHPLNVCSSIDGLSAVTPAPPLLE